MIPTHPMFMGSHSVAPIACLYLDEGGSDEARRKLVLAPGSLSRQSLPVGVLTDLWLLLGDAWALIVPGGRPASDPRSPRPPGHKALFVLRIVVTVTVETPQARFRQLLPAQCEDV